MFATTLGWLTTASLPNLVSVAALALVLAEEEGPRADQQEDKAGDRAGASAAGSVAELEGHHGH